MALGTLRLSVLPRFLRIDGLFGMLDTWKSLECWL